MKCEESSEGRNVYWDREVWENPERLQVAVRAELGRGGPRLRRARVGTCVCSLGAWPAPAPGQPPPAVEVPRRVSTPGAWRGAWG